MFQVIIKLGTIHYTIFIVKRIRIQKLLLPIINSAKDYSSTSINNFYTSLEINQFIPFSILLSFVFYHALTLEYNAYKFLINCSLAEFLYAGQKKTS